MQFCFRGDSFSDLPSPRGVLHLRCDNGNLQQMELFLKAFPGCLFPDETHLFSAAFPPQTPSRGKMVFSQPPPRRVAETKSALWKFNYHKWWVGGAGACTDRAALCSYRGRFPWCQHADIRLNPPGAVRLRFTAGAVRLAGLQEIQLTLGDWWK